MKTFALAIIVGCAIINALTANVQAVEIAAAEARAVNVMLAGAR